MSRAWHLAAGLVVLMAFGMLCDATLLRPSHNFTITENIQVAEAQAWWAGHLDLPERKWDSALYNGRVYSHFPPAFSFLSALVVPFFHGVPHWLVLLVVVIPIPLLAYCLMVRLVPKTGEAAQHRGWCVVMALGLVCGTSAQPVLEKALRGGSPYMVNQALALVGLLIFLCEYFGRGRVWVAGVGVVVAIWSRQMSVAYLIPLAWLIGNGDRAITAVFEEPSSSNPREPQSRPGKTSFVVRFGGIALVALGVPMALNWLKFDHPLESGYMYVYEGREDDVFVRDARTHGLFSPQYIPRNLYYANLGFPQLQGIRRGEQREWYVTPNDWGTGIWWTTPLLLYLFADWRRIIGSPSDRALLAGAGLAYIGLMLYHSTGFEQRGLNRYSLDYLPVLYALAVPASVATVKRRWVTAGMVAWGVFYFSIARHWPQLRVW